MTQGKSSIVLPKNTDFNNIEKERKKFIKIITCPECNHIFFIDVKELINRVSKERVEE